MEVGRERAVNEQTAVLVISHDVVGPRMAGPGIRYRELACVLSRHFEVTLAVPGDAHLPSTDFRLWPYDPTRWESLISAVERAEAILLCGDVLAWFPSLEQAGVPLIVDGYDPHPLETLELFAGTPEQEQKHQERERILHLQCRAGDFVDNRGHMNTAKQIIKIGRPKGLFKLKRHTGQYQRNHAGGHGDVLEALIQ